MRPLFLALVLVIGLTIPVAAQQKDATVPGPPYLLTQNEHLIILFEAEEIALKALLPEGIKPAAGNVVGLNMYQTQQVVGLAPYTASYLWIDIDGFDSPDGTKGRWMAQGWYGPEPVPSAIRNYMGLPVQLGVTHYQRDGNRVHAVLSSDGVNLIDATITLKAGPVPAARVLNYPALGRNLAQPALSAIVVNRVLGFGEITPATPVSMERLLDAVYVRNTASAFGAPEPTGMLADKRP
jgi:acetoacetate decarboxylase